MKPRPIIEQTDPIDDKMDRINACIELLMGAYLESGTGSGKGSINAEKAVKCVDLHLTPFSCGIVSKPSVDQLSALKINFTLILSLI